MGACKTPAQAPEQKGTKHRTFPNTDRLSSVVLYCTTIFRRCQYSDGTKKQPVFGAVPVSGVVSRFVVRQTSPRRYPPSGLFIHTGRIDATARCPLRVVFTLRVSRSPFSRSRVSLRAVSLRSPFSPVARPFAPVLSPFAPVLSRRCRGCTPTAFRTC